MNPSQTLIHTAQDGGDCYWLMGMKHRALVLREEFALAEITAPPETGTPPHIHRREDETFIVQSGRGAATFEDQTIDLLPGTTLFLPRGIRHSFGCAGDDEPLRMLVLITPGHFAQFFVEMGLKMDENFSMPTEPPDMNRILQRLQEFDIEFV